MSDLYLNDPSITHSCTKESSKVDFGMITQDFNNIHLALLRQLQRHVHSFLSNRSSRYLFRFLPTFPTMKLLPCLSPFLRRMSDCTIKNLMAWGWFHLYQPKAKESTLETLSSSSADPVPLARIVSYALVKKAMAVVYFSHDSAIQLAKLSGFSPIIVTASLHHAEYLETLGATHVIDRKVSGAALASEVNTITENAPIKYAVDSISSADTQQSGYDLLASGGKLVIFLDIAVRTTNDKEIIRALGTSAHPPNVELLGTLYHDNLERLLKEGVIKVSHSRKYSSPLHVDQIGLLAKPS